MSSAILDGLQALILVLAILLILATLQDLSGRSDVLSRATEQLFRKAIELSMLALYRIFEREVLYRLSRRGAKLDVPSETEDAQQDKPSEPLPPQQPQQRP